MQPIFTVIFRKHYAKVYVKLLRYFIFQYFIFIILPLKIKNKCQSTYLNVHFFQKNLKFYYKICNAYIEPSFLGS